MNSETNLLSTTKERKLWRDIITYVLKRNGILKKKQKEIKREEIENDIKRNGVGANRMGSCCHWPDFNQELYGLVPDKH